MPKPKSRRTSRSRAIRSALGRLGWHTSAKDVVALLADYGLNVSEGLVQKVKVEALKDSSGVKRQKAKLPQPSYHSPAPFIRKAPARRTYRR